MPVKEVIKYARKKLPKQNWPAKIFKLKDIPIHIFRLPGIYGPTRSVFERLNSEQPLRIIKKKHFFSNIKI